MTAIVRTKSVFDALLDRNVPNPQIARVIDRFLTAKGVDFSSMTNEQKAQAFLDELRKELRNVAFGQGASEEAANHRAAIQTAAENAASDLD